MYDTKCNEIKFSETEIQSNVGCQMNCCGVMQRVWEALTGLQTKIIYQVWNKVKR